MSEEEAVEILEEFKNNKLQRDKLERDDRCGGFKMGDIYKKTELNIAIETLLQSREKDKAEIDKWEKYCTEDLEKQITELNNKIFELENTNENLKQKLDEEWEEWNNLERGTYEKEQRLKAELEKKDKIINEMTKYIDFDRFDFKCSSLCVHDNCQEECIKQYFERRKR